jgi:hypothetical membrane protein
MAMDKQKIGAVAGLATPILAFTCISIAIASWPDFNWLDNALSDLGVAPGFTAPVFNFGLTAAGVLAFFFAALGVYNFFGKRLTGKVGAVVFAAATIALICIGIFNENFSPTHYIVSVAFFSLAPIGLFILTYAFWHSNHQGLALFSVIIGLVAAVPWILQLIINYVPNVAIPETISAVAISSWAVVLSVKMLNTDKTKL